MYCANVEPGGATRAIVTFASVNADCKELDSCFLVESGVDDISSPTKFDVHIYCNFMV